MSKMAFVCGGEFSGLFKAFGIHAPVMKEGESPLPLLEELAGKDYSVIYIFEKFAAGFVDAIDTVRKKGDLSVVIVPDHGSGLGLGMALARLAAIDAVGSDVIFTKKKN